MTGWLRQDRRSLVVRLPLVVGLVVALAGAVSLDRGGNQDSDGEQASRPGFRPDAVMAASRPPGAASSTWYCAAGTADEDGMADHGIVMLNPTGATHEATLTVFTGEMAAAAAEDRPPDLAETAGDDQDEAARPADAPTSPEPVSASVTLPAGESVSVELGDLVTAPLAAALVEVDGGDVAVEHRVRGPHGADTAPCSTTASPTWHVAWGATTRDARNVVVLFNPFPSTATVDAVFTTEDGGRTPVRFQGFPLPPGSVVGVDLGEDVTRSEHVSATFEARSGSIVVERLQDYDGSLGVRGLAVTPAVPAAGETWVFADSEATAPGPVTPEPDRAATDDADADDTEDADPADDEPIASERIVVYNPGDERAEVDVLAVPVTDEEGAAPQPFRLRVAPGRYQVIDYGAESRVAPGVRHTTVVRSTNGVAVVAERVTVDHGPVPKRTRRTPRGETPRRRSEITATAGARLASPEWRYPSVAVPGADTSVTFTVYNPDPDRTTEVRLELEPARDSDSAGAGGPRGANGPRGADETDEGSDADGTGGGDDGSPPDAPTPVEVAPGSSVTVELDADEAAEARSAVVVADGPVVVDRVVRLADGRRRALGLGVPAAEGAVLLDVLVATPSTPSP